MVSTPLSRSTDYSALWEDPRIWLPGRFLLFLFYGPPEWQNPLNYNFQVVTLGIIIIIIIYPFRVFHISVSWWFLLEFEWQQVSSSLQDSPKEWPFFAMLSFG